MTTPADLERIQRRLARRRLAELIALRKVAKDLRGRQDGYRDTR